MKGKIKPLKLGTVVFPCGEEAEVVYMNENVVVLEFTAQDTSDYNAPIEVQLAIDEKSFPAIRKLMRQAEAAFKKERKKP